ncbi:hypothetical protein J2X11_001414 [Aeromicrobium panaciterrae]|uniref:Uncharacterized protein n=1 Tax=Aeromicrobium panaciterrae TaxID=363861 RepID=A0ABU1UN35_9ACTN|nr:hypothetical protein [Aeromicrobium panaciterrae]MDR7086575.1 hypothetical protein [Aeromicrobium panaciterrae]
MIQSLKVVISLVAICIALVWGFKILTADLNVDLAEPGAYEFCGTVYDVALHGEARRGGEFPYEQLDALCPSAARTEVLRALMLGALGVLAIAYLVQSGRRAIREDS